MCFSNLAPKTTEVKRVRGRAQTVGAKSRRGATKKREISRTLFAFAFFHKST